MLSEEKSHAAKVGLDREKVNFILEQEDLPPIKRRFVESVVNFFETTGYLSENQLAYWHDIYCDHGPAARERKDRWVREYDDEKHEILKICAEYYTNQVGTPYFTNVTSKVLSDPHFVPTEKQWKAICDNKYTKKVLAATFSDPKYEVGSFVQFRESQKPYTLTKGELKNCGIVLETDAAPVTSAAKGAKVYRILLVGDHRPYLVEERQIKKYKRRKV